MVVNYHQAKKEDYLVVTESAKNHFIKKITTQANMIGIRFSVKKTGCSGLSYVVEYIDSKKEGDMIQPLTEQYNLYIDPMSYPFIKGVRVDYVKDGLQAKLVFDNPNQTGQCGCGESFTI